MNVLVEFWITKLPW